MGTQIFLHVCGFFVFLHVCGFFVFLFCCFLKLQIDQITYLLSHNLWVLCGSIFWIIQEIDAKCFFVKNIARREGATVLGQASSVVCV